MKAILKSKPKLIVRFKGGTGSGNFGHSGRPGHVGGSGGSGTYTFAEFDKLPLGDKRSIITKAFIDDADGQLAYIADFSIAMRKGYANNNYFITPDGELLGIDMKYIHVLAAAKVMQRIGIYSDMPEKPMDYLYGLGFVRFANVMGVAVQYNGSATTRRAKSTMRDIAYANMNSPAHFEDVATNKSGYGTADDMAAFIASKEYYAIGYLVS